MAIYPQDVSECAMPKVYLLCPISWNGSDVFVFACLLQSHHPHNAALDKHKRRRRRQHHRSNSLTSQESERSVVSGTNSSASSTISHYQNGFYKKKYPQKGSNNDIMSEEMKDRLLTFLDRARSPLKNSVKERKLA